MNMMVVDIPKLSNTVLAQFWQLTLVLVTGTCVGVPLNCNFPPSKSFNISCHSPLGPGMWLKFSVSVAIIKQKYITNECMNDRANEKRTYPTYTEAQGRY